MRDGWEATTLGEVADLIVGRTPPRKDERYWTVDLERPFCTIADMGAMEVLPEREGVTEAAEIEGKAKRVPAGSLLMSFKLTIGRVGFAAVDLFPNEAIVWIKPREGVPVVDRYLALWLSHLDLTESAGQAVKGQTLNGPSLRAIPVDLPSLLVQRRVVDLVDAVDTYAAAAAARAEAARGARSALLDRELSGDGDGWTETTLGEAATLIMGQSPPGSSYNDRGEGLPFLQGSAEFGSRHPAPVKWCSDPRRVAQPGDVLVSVRAPVGDLNVADIETAIGRGLAIIRGGADALTDFLMLAVEAGLDELLSRSGSGMFTSITKDGLASLPLALPPLAVQRRVVDLVKAAEDEAVQATRTAEAAGSLRSALLSELLSGEREVPGSYDDLVGVA